MENEKKLPKPAVRYGKGHSDSRCEICRFFEPQDGDAPDRCRFVAGAIDAQDWCELFNKKPAKG